LQVFVIAAREFLDFAVFLFYILVLLGSAVFAFFQLTGGNYQFLRFPDGLSLMSRLTFGTHGLGTVMGGPTACMFARCGAAQSCHRNVVHVLHILHLLHAVPQGALLQACM
jgi:hypothetical protein